MLLKKGALLIVLFIGAVGLTQAITPKSQLTMNSTIELETAIPKQFGDWKMIELKRLQVVNPDDNSLVDQLYSQVLERSYVNSQGQVVMLSIAYGAEQRKDMLAHFPEVCYPAQGFNVNSEKLSEMVLQNRSIPVKHLVTQKGNRVEDITYFVRVGEKIVATRTDQKWEAVKYGLQGVIPDGLIFRASTIGVLESHRVHLGFISELLNVTDVNIQNLLVAN